MEQNIITPLDQYEPQIGAWMWALQDARQRTLNSLKGLDDQTINWVAPDAANSIGTLLYHIAAIEMSWLYEDILEGINFPAEVGGLLSYDVRDDDGQLTLVVVETLEKHLNRLKVTRQYFLSATEGMSLDEFRRSRKLDSHEVSPEWVIHHLMQHEAEHRGQIGEIRGMAERALGKGKVG